jgi:hypothetical protein
MTGVAAVSVRAMSLRYLAETCFHFMSTYEQIEHARYMRDQAGAELAMLIDRAVDQGIGWPEIATQLGVTRQAARQHYQRRHRGGASHQDRVD